MATESFLVRYQLWIQGKAGLH